MPTSAQFADILRSLESTSSAIFNDTNVSSIFARDETVLQDAY